MAMIRLEKLFRGTPARLIGLIHDEVLIEIPGKSRLQLVKREGTDDVYEPQYVPDEEAAAWAESARLELERAQTGLFDSIVSDQYKGRFKGKAEADISLFWSH